MRVVVVEGDEYTREGLKHRLSYQAGIEIAAIGVDGCDALVLCNEHKPDVAIFAMELSFVNGANIAESIKIRFPDMGIIIIAGESDDETVMDVFANGALGLILRSSVYEEIIPALHRVHNEKDFYSSNEITSKIMRLFTRFASEKAAARRPAIVPCAKYEAEEPLALRLTKTELIITCCVGEGLSNQQIAKKLNIKEGTVRNYISSILKKTDLRHRTQIAIFAFNNGFGDEKAFRRRHKAEKQPSTQITARRGSDALTLEEKTVSK